MTQESVFYLNGEFVAPEAAKISPLDRAFLMGDAVYEVVRINNGRPFHADGHYDRMKRGLAELRAETPLSRDEFKRLVASLAERNGVQGGLVYLQISRGAAERNHLLPKGGQPTVFGFAKSADLPSWKTEPNGVKAALVRDLRWGRCDIKTTMLLPNSLAKQQARDADAFEAILVADDGVVREGAMTNLFIVRNGELATHPLTESILPGITRRSVIEIAAKEGIKVRETTFTAEELKAADEAILVGTGTDVCPVVKVDETQIGEGVPGPVTLLLAKRLEEMMLAETSG